MSKTVRIAVLVSGGGSNLGAILDEQKAGRLPGIQVVLVLSSKAGAPALARAQTHQIETAVVERKLFGNDAEYDSAVLDKLIQSKADVVCLAGYLKKLGPSIIERFRERILNIHPALLPKYGGPGMYGIHVHEAVLKAREKESGCTVHLVDEEFDHGQILEQARIPIKHNDTPETLAKRVLEKEHQLYPKVIREYCEQL